MEKMGYLQDTWVLARNLAAMAGSMAIMSSFFFDMMMLRSRI